MRRYLLLATCLVPLTAFAQGTDDRGFLTGLLEDNLSGAGRQVRIEGFQGALSSRAQIAEMTIADDQGVWLRLADVTLDWSRAALLVGRVEVNSLTAGTIELTRLPQTDPDTPSPEATPFALPDLPVSIRVGELKADAISLGPTILGEPVTARLEGSANLSGGEGEAKLSLDRTDGIMGKLALEGAFANASRELTLDLALQEPQGGIAARMIGLPGEPALDLSIAGKGPLSDFTADVALASDGQDRFAGTVKLASDADGNQRFGVDLTGDVTPLFLPEYREFFGPDVALFADGFRTPEGLTTLQALRLRAAALSVEGSASIAADGLPQALKLAVDLGAPDGQPVRLPVSGDPVLVAGALLDLTYDAATGDEGWQLTGQLSGLDTAAARAERLDLTGSGRIARQPDGRKMAGGALQFDGVGLALADPALAEALGTALRGNVRFDWAEGQPLALPELHLEGTGYAADANVTVAGEVTALTVDGSLTATLDDLSRLSRLAGRPLSGAGELRWQGAVTPLSGAFDGEAVVQGANISLGQPEADALLRGTSTIRLDAARSEQGTQIRALSVQAQTLRMAGQGWIRSTGPDLLAHLDFADLSVLGGARGGRLVADATLKGAALDNDLTLTLKGQGTDLKPGIAQADGLLRGQTALDIAAHLLDGTVTVQRALVNGSSWRVDATGAVSETARDVTAKFDFADLSLAGPGFGGKLAGDVTYTLQAGREQAALSANAAGLSVGQAEADRLLRGTTSLSASASREDGVIRLEGLRLDNPQLTARADAQQADGRRRVDLTARLGDLALLVPGVPGALNVTGRVDEADGRLTLDLTAQGPGGINAAVAGTAASDFSTVALKVNGAADAALANAFLGPVALRGPLRFDLAVNGAPALQSVSGQVMLSNGRLTLTSPPFAFSGVAATIGLSGGRANVDVRAQSDAGGTVTVSGPVALTAPYSGDLRIALQALMLRDPQLYESRATGALTVSGPLTGGARIAGDIALTDTELRIPSTGLGGAAAIPDLRHVGEPAAVRRTRARAGLLGEAGGTSGSSARAFPLDVTIYAPNQVFIRGRGLDAELGGSFRITGSTANVIPSGGLELIRGRLDLLGKRFAFTEGQMQMEGSLIPTIRLVATTDTVDGTASVVVDGPADAPVIQFLSSPELPEEEVVARLLFGRGLTTLTPIQAAQLASAVATLTGKGGSGVVDRLRKSFGLDDFDVTASESGAAAVRAGKYLSDNIYVDLTLGSGDESEVSINLDLSPSVTVRGRTSADGNTGIGIHYERDY
ncbi:translocation/assembly module TamB domain-containing protein [Gemmobacter sp.]|uniref:translocation/assembly module TamB domain-containing protein n=1 Tax=Gemmobacter sp. TaxID=1898957 RepID=UPI002AFFE8FF|nr:translocation/assembly module TamB domain-containing protein [Gemmobacter sp.]